MFILKMLEASIQKREKWIKSDMAVEDYMKTVMEVPTRMTCRLRLGTTADALHWICW